MLTVFTRRHPPTLPDELWALCDVLCVDEPELQLLTGRKVRERFRSVR